MAQSNLCIKLTTTHLYNSIIKVFQELGKLIFWNVLKTFCKSTVFQACLNDVPRTVPPGAHLCKSCPSTEASSELLATLHLYLPAQHCLHWVNWLLYFLMCAWFVTVSLVRWCAHQGWRQCLCSSTEYSLCRGNSVVPSLLCAVFAQCTWRWCSWPWPWWAKSPLYDVSPI